MRLKLAAVLLAAMAFLAAPNHASAQFPGSCVYPFAGAQPQNSCDFSNPPVTFNRQGGVFAAPNIPIGSVAYGSLGNATTYVSGTIYCTAVYVPADMTVTNINVLNGGTVGTNSVIYALFNTVGTLLRTTALAGVATAGANAFQTIALTSPIAIQGPGKYNICVQANGTTDNMRTIAASTFIDVQTGSQTGVFGTIPNLTAAPAAFVANVGPISYLN